jgi:hypothetical protein
MVSLPPRQRALELLEEVVWSQIELDIKATALPLMHIVSNRNYEVQYANLGMTERARFCNLRIQTESQKTNITKAKTSVDTSNDRKMSLFNFFLRCCQREVLLRHYNGIYNKHTMLCIRVKVEGISSEGEMSELRFSFAFYLHDKVLFVH